MQLDDAFFSKLPWQELLAGMPEEIRAKVVLKKIAAGETVVRKGEKVQYAYILLEGELKVIDEFANGRLYIFARLRSLSFVSELEILAGEVEYSCTIEASKPCKMLMMAAQDFAKWIACDPSMLLTVSKVMAIKMYHRTVETGTAIFLSGMRKMQAYLVKHYQEKSEQMEVVLIDRKRQQIADEIGVSVKTINRCVERLKNAEMVLVKRGKIYITQEQCTKLLLEINDCD